VLWQKTESELLIISRVKFSDPKVVKGNQKDKEKAAALVARYESTFNEASVLEVGVIHCSLRNNE
jgi:hypothetical protein